MNKIMRILGKKGRTTIPYELRMLTGFAPNDILSFEQGEGDSIIIRREKVCGGYSSGCVKEAGINSVDQYIDSLTPEERRHAFLYLALGPESPRPVGKHEKIVRSL